MAWRLYHLPSQGASNIIVHCHSLRWVQSVAPWEPVRHLRILQPPASHSPQATGFKHTGSISGGHSTQLHSWRTNSRSLLPPSGSLMITSNGWLGLQWAKDSVKRFTGSPNPSWVFWEPHLIGNKGKQVPSPTFKRLLRRSLSFCMILLALWMQNLTSKL